MNNQSMKIDISNIVHRIGGQSKDDHNLTNDMNTLKELFEDRKMRSLLQIHKILLENRPIPCVAIDLMNSIFEIQQLSYAYLDNDVLSALCAMFNTSAHLVALLTCHDKIACKTFNNPQVSDIEESSVLLNDGCEETMKVVRLVKGDEPLGATIAADRLTGDIVIARILKGGAADRSGLIHVNDILIEVNDVSAKGKKPTDLIKHLAGYRGPLTFKLIPCENSAEPNVESVFVRAHYTYLPQADSLIPCVEAGLTFYCGDILCVVSKDDSAWWQAMKVETLDKTKENGAKVGLVPSLKLQIRREKLNQEALSKSTAASLKGSNISLMSNPSSRRNAWKRIRSSFRQIRHTHVSNAKRSLIENHISYYPPYEIVAKYDPTSAKLGKNGMKTYRPIILVGPQGVGRNELKDRLIDSNPSHYGVPVPHTSRLQQPGEVDKKDYHFVCREFIENGIHQGRFLEYGEYKGNYYGTSLDAVHAVIESGLVCVLTPHPQALTLLRTKEFMSYIIFIKPPSVVEMGKLPDEIDVGLGKLTTESPMTLPDEEMQNLVSRGERMQSLYGRLFDVTIVNNDSDCAFNKLKEISFYLENDQQWIPADWIS